MSISTTNPALKALHEALCALVTETNGRAAAVLDEGNGLWCITDTGFEQAADRFYREEIASGGPEGAVKLTRGSGLSLVRQKAEGRAFVAESFASIYVVVVWFERDFDPFTARRVVREALPRIEALTLSLPPPFGPDAGEGAGRA